MQWMPPHAAWVRRRGAEVLREPAGPLEPLIEQALREGRGLVVLGAFGSGKTETARRVGAAMGVPVIPLRMLARAADPDALLSTLLGASDAAILDGLDEIGRPADTGVAEFFDRVTARVPRWVLTSRPGHIRTELSDPDPLQVDCFHLPMVEILPYALEEGVPGFCAENAVLAALWRSGARGETPSSLIEDFLAPTGRADVLEELAWRSFADPDASREGGSFDVAAVRDLPPQLFVVDLDGRTRFGHRSLYDALVARRLVRLLAAGQGRGPDALTGLHLSGAMRVFCVGPFEGWRHDDTWTHVSRGNFISGGSRSADERPLVVKHLTHDLRVCRRPVTNGEFQSFLDGAGPRPPAVEFLSHWRGGRCPAALLDHPVSHLRPEDADACAAWAGMALPTADAWEKAVRGWDGRNFPWGDSFDAGRANTAEAGLERTVPVETHLQGSGLYAAIGDVFEYTSSDYRDRPDRGRIVMGGSCTHLAMRASLRLSHTLSGRLRVGLRYATGA